MFEILSWNINGFRSVLKKGHLNDILAKRYDIICFQEAKLSDAGILYDVVPKDYHIYVNLSQIKGRNGVIILSKRQPITATYILGNDRFDTEGRYIKLDYEDFTLINLYMPHGQRDKSQLDYKLEISKLFIQELKRLSDKNVIVATDFNIAAKDIDVCRADQNYKNIMFTEAERKVVNNICKIGYKDSFRELYPGKVEYTWWTYAFNCREKNIGWRIDYFFVTAGVFKRTKEVEILKEKEGSDHCPIVIRIRGKEDG